MTAGQDYSGSRGEITPEMAKDALVRARDLLKVAQESGVNVDDIKEIFLQAKPAFTSNDFATAYNIASQVIDMINSRMNPPQIQQVHQPVAKKVVKKKVVQKQPSQTEGSVQPAQMEPQAQGASQQDAINALSEAKNMLAQAKKMGYDISAIAEKFRSAKPYLDAGDFNSAYLIALEVKQMIQDLTSQSQQEAGGGGIDEEAVLERLGDAQARMIELQNAGVDVSQLADIFSRAKEMFDSGDLTGAISLLDEFDRTADSLTASPETTTPVAMETPQPPQQPPVEETQPAVSWEQPPEQVPPQQEAYEQPQQITPDMVKTKLLEARNIIKQMKSMGYDTSDLESVYMEAKPAFQSGDLDGAYAIAEQVIMMANEMQQPAQPAMAETQEAYTPEAVPETYAGAGVDISSDVAEAREIMEFLKGYSVPVVDDEQELNNIIQRASMGDTSAITDIRNLVERLKQKREEVYSRMAEDEIENARKAARECDEKGIEIPEILEEIMNAEAALRSGNYSEAFELARNARIKAENAEKYNEAKAHLDLVMATIGYLRRLGVDTSEVNSIIAEANNFLNEGNYDAVIDACRLAEEKAEEIKRREAATIVNSMIMSLRKDLQFLKDEGVDTAEIEGYISGGEELAASGEYDKAKENLDKAKELIDSEMERFLGKRAMNAIMNIQSALSNARNEGIDVSDAEAKYEEARKLYESSKYREAIELCEEAEDLIRTARKKKELIGILREAKEKINEAKAAGADVSHAESLFNSAKPAIKAGDYDKAMEYGLRAKKEAEEALLSHDVFRLIEEIQAKINEAKKLGIPTVNIEEDLARTKEALGEGDMETAHAIAKQAEMEITNKIERHKEAVNSIEKIEAELNNMKSMGIRSPMAESLLDEAKRALDALKYPEVEELVERINNQIKDATRRYEEAFEAIQAAQTKISEAKKLGASTKQAEAIFANVAAALDDANYEEAAEYARQAEEAAILSKQRYERAFDVVAEAQKKISEAKKLGADVTVAETYMKQIPQALDDGDYDKVMDLARKAEKKADEIKRMTEQLVDLIKITKDKIESYRKMGADVREAEKLFQEMIKAVDRSDFEEALQIGESALEAVERARLVQEQLIEEIRAAQSKISEAKKLGVDISKAMAVFNQIPISRNAGDYAKAISLAREAREKVEQALMRYNALQQIQYTFQRVNEGKTLGIDVSECEELLAQARAALKLEDYEGAIKLAKQSANELAAKILGEKISSEQ